MGLGLMKQCYNSGSWDGTRLIRFATKLLAISVFLGHVLLWFLMPTTRFLDVWFIKIQAKIKPTYFGKLGAYIVIYTFPVMFIATLGCLYLQLGNKNSNRNAKSKKSSWFDSWKRPVLVKGLLGIVSWIELAFFGMFVALLVWFFYSYMDYYSASIAKYAAEEGFKVWQEKSYFISYVLGLVGNVSLAFLFFPVTRGSSVMLLFGLTSESSIKYHIWIGHITMILVSAHGFLYIFSWAITYKLSEMLKWDTIWISNVAGEVSLLAGLAMWGTCLPRVRRKLFELFFYTHYLYIIFMIFYLFHVGFPYLCTSIGGFYLFVIDRFLRFLQSQQKIQLVSARILSCNVVELNFSKSSRLSYNPTSILFINVPTLSKLQWHPFTISSSSNLDPEVVSVVVKSEGSWSKKLCQKLTVCSPLDCLEIALEGPYGPRSTDYLRHDMLVMVSGGSGITSFISILRELLFISSAQNTKTLKILLICAFKNSQDLAILNLILPDPASGAVSFDVSHLNLRIEAYVTRQNNPIPHDQEHIKTIMFKPNALDSPLAPILGPNSWLYLGGVIVFSFVVFLLLVGVLTQFYIYPIDHNTDEIFNNTSRSGLYMLFMCVSIGLVSSGAFLWNKKQNLKEMKLMKPRSEFCDGDREMGSFPHQSLAQAINVNYGTRPNLKRILLEIEESSVQVLASGPRKLRQDVAKICSSGLADNLHFESISFSW